MRTLFFITILFLFASCSAQKISKEAPAMLTHPSAFPGAEGFGKYTTGGREGKVFIVTNLDDNGPGSFREAAEAKGKRIIVFAVSGTIHLVTQLSIKGDVTIAGQTAPGDGICLADQSVGIGGNNIIVRYLRFRLGDKYQKGGQVDGNGGDDAFGGNRRNQVIIDHCSMSWSTDECFSIYGGDNTTLQWNLIAEPMNYSYHFETGDTGYEHHGFGGIWGGSHLSAHHNLFAHCNSRNPRFNGTRLGAKEEFVDYSNNVIYDWGSNNVYGGEGGNYNIVNNYYKYGPSTSKTVLYRIVNPSRQEKPVVGFGKYFVDGNYVDGSVDVTKNNFLGIHMGMNGTAEEKKEAVVDVAFPTEEINLHSAREAYDLVLQSAGASLPARDTLDQRIIKEVKSRTGQMIDVQGHYPHGTPYEQTVTAWPALKSLPAPADTDKDGMPDEWEKQNGLNPNNADDASIYTLSKSFTNIEIYINSLVK